MDTDIGDLLDFCFYDFDFFCDFGRFLENMSKFIRLHLPKS